MNWKPRFLLLLAFSVPAFTGYPVQAVNRLIIPGITYGWAIYFITASAAILLLLGKRHFMDVMTVAALITLPVVFVGGTISYGFYICGWAYPAGSPQYSPHYVSLCLTMLTVIPLSLSLVAVIPFHEIESVLLEGVNGVSSSEKILLMFLRVFNHIVHFVIPNIIEVLREERRLIFTRGKGNSGNGNGWYAICKNGKRRFARLIQDMIQIGVEGICAAVRYIPLWAVEISQLPGRRAKRNDKTSFKS
jgi:hypothetical protein